MYDPPTPGGCGRYIELGVVLAMLVRAIWWVLLFSCFFVFEKLSFYFLLLGSSRV